eukprot:scaffold1982_cov93-Amphora_coffeaeformis.AAC.4
MILGRVGWSYSRIIITALGLFPPSSCYENSDRGTQPRKPKYKVGERVPSHGLRSISDFGAQSVARFLLGHSDYVDS